MTAFTISSLDSVIHIQQVMFFITITEIIKETLGKDEYTCEECLDIQKVFETVNHEILFDKLAQFCIRRLNLNWFQSYLTNRKHKTL